jgi:hypothetical protein
VRLPISESARCEELTRPLKQTAKTGSEWIFLHGGDPVLDGERIRHVAFINSEIHYAGGRVILDNLVFFNARLFL